jgi:hypothetical protein
VFKPWLSDTFTFEHGWHEHPTGNSAYKVHTHCPRHQTYASVLSITRFEAQALSLKVPARLDLPTSPSAQRKALTSVAGVVEPAINSLPHLHDLQSLLGGHGGPGNNRAQLRCMSRLYGGLCLGMCLNEYCELSQTNKAPQQRMQGDENATGTTECKVRGQEQTPHINTCPISDDLPPVLSCLLVNQHRFMNIIGAEQDARICEALTLTQTRARRIH